MPAGGDAAAASLLPAIQWDEVDCEVADQESDEEDIDGEDE